MKPLLSLLLCGICQAVPVNFAWDKTPTATRYDIYKINPLTHQGEWFGWSEGETFSGVFDPGTYQIAVIASNAKGYGPPSDNLTFVVPEAVTPFSWSMSASGTITTSDGNMIKVSIEFSADLKLWTDKPFPAARFYRVKATTP